MLDQEKERERFEAWFEDDGISTEALATARAAWLARAALDGAQGVGEPVAWQWRVIGPNCDVVSGWAEGRMRSPSEVGLHNGYRTEERPLYAAPPPLAPPASVSVPNGWVLVPKHPTEDMVDAGRDRCASRGAAETVYRSMLYAAPPPPATEEARDLLPIFLPDGIGSRLSNAMSAYLAEYVFGLEDGPDHEPSEFERAMLEDFLAGAISDEAVNDILQEAARALAAEEVKPAAQAGVKVKPLEWIDLSRYSFAASELGQYEACDDEWWFSEVRHAGPANRAAAKAAAQADYERRILSAIASPPQPPPAAEEVEPFPYQKTFNAEEVETCPICAHSVQVRALDLPSGGRLSDEADTY